jgi:hypothetical protein
MKGKRSVIFATLALMAAGTAGLNAQEPPPTPASPLRAYIDCSYYCDQDFMRTELTWISYMRDRTDAQVHVLVTTQSTGGGGSQFTLTFIGLKEFEGKTDTLTYTASSDDTEDMRRRGLTRTISLGLVGFVARTPFAQRLSVSAPAEAAGAPAAGAAQQPERDPWNYWRFTIGLNGFGNGESATKYYNMNGSITANRTTENWKINTRLSGNQRQNIFEYEDDEGVPKKTVSTYKNYGLNALIVKSLGPHLSAGVTTNVSASTVGNTSLALSLAPAIEYNFMPYSESTRRQLTVRYSTGVRYADYREITIFGEKEETRPNHELEIEYGTTQPWGRIGVSLNGAQYLHDTQKYNAGIGGNTEIRLFKGFRFNIGGDYSVVRDQLHIVGRDLTEEEILLQQRQQATNYRYFVSAGISYSFGSIFNNVVNPRFGGSGGGGVVIFM